MRRPKNEIIFLMSLLERYIEKEINKLIKKNIKLKVLGNINKFQNHLRKNLSKHKN